MKTSTFYITVVAIILLFSLTASGVFAQTVYNLDKADKIETKDTAILNGKTFKVYENKSGRLYIETGISKKTGKPTRKYITPAVKKTI